MSSIEKQVKRFYREQSLSPEKLELLLNETRRRRHRRWLPKLSAAAVLLLVVVGLLVSVHYPLQVKNNVLLQEVSLNHRSKLQLEFNASELDELTVAMSELDFPLIMPEKFRHNVNLVGARYCTLNGKLAAHLKLKDSDSADSISLFMTRTDTDFEKLGTSDRAVDGVQLSSWSSNGLFYVLAASR